MQARGSSWRKVRIAALLCILGGAAARWVQVRRAESWVPDWSATQRVAVVLLTPPRVTEEEQAELERLLRFASLGEGKATLSALEDWLRVEHERFAPGSGLRPVDFEAYGPFEVSSLPPPPPRAGADLSFVERYRRTSAFLGWYEERLRERTVFEPNVVFVTFYGPEGVPHFRGVHSVSDRRSRRGFVFAPLTGEGRDAALINVGHELLHLFGATDKYDGERCVFPHGWVEPFAEPRLPQRYAEVMAQGIPVEAGRKEASLDLFEEMRVGVETAFEIGWIDRARRDRYYGGDTSAGPRMDD
jgi:hypothetical protein